MFGRSHYSWIPHRIINGVKEMCGFRQTFNFSYSISNDSHETCSAASCSEDIAESTILVRLVGLALWGGIAVPGVLL